MMRRLFLVCSTLVLTTPFVHAEAQRALLTHENRFPEVGKAEIGAYVDYLQFNNGDQTDLRPYGRYTVINNLTLNASVPYEWTNPDNGSNENGFGDTDVGLELLAYQDIFEYPWIIPHVDTSFSTGD